MAVKLGLWHYGRNIRLRVFENRVLRIFRSKTYEATGGWRKLHNEELRNLYSLSSIIRMIMSRRMKWPEPVARMGATRIGYRILTYLLMELSAS
jgi:hypothetical protein